MRQLRRVPGFSLAVIAILALGIGANTAVFSVTRAVLLRPLPYDHADSLVMIWERNFVRDRATNVVAPATSWPGATKPVRSRRWRRSSAGG
jgi:hypothetical protein